MPIDIDLLMRHELMLDRKASEGINTHLFPSLRDAYLEIRRRTLDTELTTPGRLRKLEQQVRAAILTNNGWEPLTEDMLAVGLNESQFQAAAISAMVAANLKTPAERQVQGFINQSLMSLEQGSRTKTALWREFVEQAQESQISQVNTIIRQGFQRGEAASTVVRNIRSSFNDVIRRDAETLARTGYAHYQAAASEAMADAQTIPMEYYYSAVFDNRTTLGCMSLHGTRWPLDSPNVVRTPRHFNCRSRLLTVPKGEEVTGEKVAVGAKDSKAAREAFEERDRRRRTASQVRRRGRADDNVFDPQRIDAKTSYGDWLERQPDYFVEDTLGETRAKLFKEGNLSIDKFTDMRGNPLTLDQLRARDAEAFRRAGL